MLVNYLRNDDDLESALAALSYGCPLIEAALQTIPRPGLRLDRAGFLGLCQIIVFQQISISAGNAILGRFLTALPEVTPSNLLAIDETLIKAAGLSRGKISTMRNLATALLDQTASLEDTDSLLAIKGIGPWTVEIYRLTCMGDPDVWPSGDIALQQALGDLLGLETRPTAKETLPLVEKYRPYRAVLARILWGLYRKNKNMPPV
jgi:DNA-3-methyladenine glycosylase II